MTDADLLARVAPVDLEARARAALAACASAPVGVRGAALSLARSLAGGGHEAGFAAGPDPTPRGAEVALLGVPCGLGLPGEPVADLVDGVVSRVREVEPGRLGLAGACAMAAAVGAGLLGARFEEALGLALSAADGGEAQGEAGPGPVLSARLSWAVALATRTDGDPVDVLDMLVGADGSVQEAVPVAFALAAVCWATPDAAARSAHLISRLTCPDAVVAPLVSALLGARFGAQSAGDAPPGDSDGVGGLATRVLAARRDAVGAAQ